MNILRKKFEENGYLILKNIFTKKKLKKIFNILHYYANKDFDGIMNPDRSDFLISQSTHIIDRQKTLKDKNKAVTQINKDSKFLRKIILDKKILQKLSKIKGKKVNGLMSQALFKKAKTKSAKQSWLPHQDNSYIKNKGGHYITLNLFFKPAYKSNGSLYIYEKSHKYGLFKFDRQISYREKNNRPGNHIRNLRNFKKKDLSFKAGDLLVLHGNLIHGSYENKSARSRPLYSMCYIPKGEYFTIGFNAQRKILTL